MPRTLMEYFTSPTCYHEGQLGRFLNDRTKVTQADISKLEKDTADFFEQWLDRTGKREKYERLVKNHVNALQNVPHKYGGWYGCLGGETELYFSGKEIEFLLFGNSFPSSEQRQLKDLREFVEAARASERETRHTPKFALKISRAVTRFIDNVLGALTPGFAQ